MATRASSVRPRSSATSSGRVHDSMPRAPSLSPTPNPAVGTTSPRRSSGPSMRRTGLPVRPVRLIDGPDEEAHRAYRETGGLFDPRVLDVLLSWGYDRSLPFGSGEVDRTASSVPMAPLPDSPDGAFPWWPEVAHGDIGWRLNLAGQPIDLGGIGKGLAVRWAAAELANAGQGYSVDAGGDCAFGGVGPDGDGWHVGVEDPADPDQLLLVLDLIDTGCATSSTRLRRWRVGGTPVHHLVDPRTRRPGGDGLVAVTAVASDPAWSEVWSKTLFLAGAAEIRSRAERLELAAAWVEEDGTVGTTAQLDPMVIWRRGDV